MDRNNIINSIRVYEKWEHEIGLKPFERTALKALQEQLKIVYCKNCKYYNYRNGECILSYGSVHMVLRNDNDYCSRGEYCE